MNSRKTKILTSEKFAAQTEQNSKQRQINNSEAKSMQDLPPTNQYRIIKITKKPDLISKVNNLISQKACGKGQKPLLQM